MDSRESDRILVIIVLAFSINTAIRRKVRLKLSGTATRISRQMSRDFFATIPIVISYNNI